MQKDNGKAIKIDPKVDIYDNLEIFEMGELVETDACEDCCVYASSCGLVRLDLKWPLEK